MLRVAIVEDSPRDAEQLNDREDSRNSSEAVRNW